MLPRSDAPAQAVVADANRAAAGLTATDPRWVLALRVAVSLAGGRAAVLTPDKRRSMERLAGRLGLRPFDAALVIAIVQDASRRGESIADRGPGPAVAARLQLVRPVDPPRDDRDTVRLWAAATVLAVAIFVIAMSIVGR